LFGVRWFHLVSDTPLVLAVCEHRVAELDHQARARGRL
jgi:hypothetical protein